MNKAYRRIKSEIDSKQWDLFLDIGTRNSIFMIRMVTESAIHMQYICVCVCVSFIDYTKASGMTQKSYFNC